MSEPTLDYAGVRVLHFVGYTAALEEIIARSGLSVTLKPHGGEPQEARGSEAVEVVRRMWDLHDLEVAALDAARPYVWLQQDEPTP